MGEPMRVVHGEPAVGDELGSRQTYPCPRPTIRPDGRYRRRRWGCLGSSRRRDGRSAGSDLGHVRLAAPCAEGQRSRHCAGNRASQSAATAQNQTSRPATAIWTSTPPPIAQDGKRTANIQGEGRRRIRHGCGAGKLGLEASRQAFHSWSVAKKRFKVSSFRSTNPPRKPRHT
jgi:hypothetical protein